MSNRLAAFILSAAWLLTGCVSSPERGVAGDPGIPDERERVTAAAGVEARLEAAIASHVQGRQVRALRDYQAVEQMAAMPRQRAAALLGLLHLRTGRNSKLRDASRARELALMLDGLAEESKDPLVRQMALAGRARMEDVRLKAEYRATSKRERARAGKLEAALGERDAELAQRDATIKRLKELTIGR